MTSTTRTSIWRKNEHDSTSITFYPETTATWDQMNTWLEKVYGKNGKDLHWKWMGFGKVGTEDFRVVLVRRPCTKWMCKKAPCCDTCGLLECGMEKNDDGEFKCDECVRAEETGEE
jgi:hypothetical protein